MGPLLFCISLHRFIQRLNSPFCVGYLDDISLGGPVSSLLSDLTIVKEAESIGLVLNPTKSEIITNDENALLGLRASLPGALSLVPGEASLLGSPLGDPTSLSSAISDKISSLRLLGECLQLFSSHYAFLLLRYSFAIPLLTFPLRTCLPSCHLYSRTMIHFFAPFSVPSLMSTSTIVPPLGFSLLCQ